MPPLLWHAELGKSLPDAWTGQHQRGVQLHDLRDAVAHLAPPLRAARVAAPAGRAGRGRRGDAADGGRRPAHHRPAGRQAVPDHPRAGPRLGQRPAAAQHRGRDGLLRRARRRHLHGDGAAARRPAAATPTTRAASGPATTSSCSRARSWARRSRSTSRSPTDHAVGALHHAAAERLRAHVLQPDVGGELAEGRVARADEHRHPRQRQVGDQPGPEERVHRAAAVDVDPAVPRRGERRDRVVEGAVHRDPWVVAAGRVVLSTCTGLPWYGQSAKGWMNS